MFYFTQLALVLSLAFSAIDARTSPTLAAHLSSSQASIPSLKPHFDQLQEALENRADPVEIMVEDDPETLVENVPEEVVPEVMDGADFVTGFADTAGDIFAPISAAVAPLGQAIQPVQVAINTPVSATLSALGSKATTLMKAKAVLAAPFIGAKAAIAAPFVGLKAKAAGLAIKGGALVGAKFLKLAGLKTLLKKKVLLKKAGKKAILLSGKGALLGAKGSALGTKGAFLSGIPAAKTGLLSSIVGGPMMTFNGLGSALMPISIGADVQGGQVVDPGQVVFVPVDPSAFGGGNQVVFIDANGEAINQDFMANNLVALNIADGGEEVLLENDLTGEEPLVLLDEAADSLQGSEPRTPQNPQILNLNSAGIDNRINVLGDFVIVETDENGAFVQVGGTRINVLNPFLSPFSVIGQNNEARRTPQNAGSFNLF